MNKKNKRKNKPVLIVLLLAAVVLLVSLVVYAGILNRDMASTEDATTTSKTEFTETTEPDETTEIGQIENVDHALLENLYLTKIGTYTGAYMEDATDEFVAGVLMIVVENRGEKPLQYAEITLSGDAGDAHFTLSTVNPGQSVVVLESQRKAFTSAEDFSNVTAQNVVFFDEPLNTRDDILKIQALDGGFNITNISDQDITGEIVVYFKHSAGDMLYGGITFRGRIEGGMKAGEVRQVISTNFNASATTVMFVTIEGE